MTAIVELKNATKVVNNGFDEKTILDNVSLTIHKHDFITILGGNGAGNPRFSMSLQEHYH